MTSVTIGVDTTTGLDGPDIFHPMSPDGGHIAVCGPPGLRAAFRERFVESVENLGGHLILRDAAAPERLLRTLRTRSWEDRVPTLLVVPPDLDYAAQDYVSSLTRTGRAYGVTVFTEHLNYSSHYAHVADSYTTVLLGPESAQWTKEVPGAHWTTKSYTQEYVFQNGTTRPVVLG